jgi:hypothetical protein
MRHTKSWASILLLVLETGERAPSLFAMPAGIDPGPQAGGAVLGAGFFTGSAPPSGVTQEVL